MDALRVTYHLILRLLQGLGPLALILLARLPQRYISYQHPCRLLGLGAGAPGRFGLGIMTKRPVDEDGYGNGI